MSSRVLLYVIPYNQLWGVSGLKDSFYTLKEELLDASIREPHSPFFGGSPSGTSQLKSHFAFFWNWLQLCLALKNV